MTNTRSIKNLSAIALLALSTAGALYSGNIYWKQKNINERIRGGEIIKDDNFPYQEKYSSAYFQGSNGDFKHSVQTFSQLLDMKAKLKLSDSQLSPIQYNIGNNLFLSALARRQNDDGSLNDDSKNDLIQAKIAYEQSLRLDPELARAKFNLALLNSVLAEAPKSAPKEQAGVELSNLPIGLP